MSQHDFNIANQGFPATRSDINNALAALASTSSGTSEPSTTYANQFWYDTTNNLLKFRNEADSAWITLAYLDQGTNEWEIRSAVIQAVDSAGVIIKTDDGIARVTVADDGTTDITGTLTSDGLSVDGTTTLTGGGTGSIHVNVEDSSLCPTMTFTRNGVGTTGNGFLKFENSGGQVAEIDATGGGYFLGDVGIGTSSASAALDVNSSVNGTQAYFGTSSNRDLIISSAASGGNDDALTKFTKSSSIGELAFLNLSGERMRILAGGGITFNGDTAAANALDDYEEGTWTPVISDGTVTYTAQRGRYTKIGRTVHIHAFIHIATISGASGTDLVSGLPFTAKGDSNYTALASKTNGYDWGGSSTMITFQVVPGQAKIGGVGSGNNQTFTDLNTSGLSAGDWIAFSGHYVTDA